jgi:hypothetical protein
MAWTVTAIAVTVYHYTASPINCIRESYVQRFSV